jgi:hypothetical protein
MHHWVPADANVKRKPHMEHSTTTPAADRHGSCHHVLRLLDRQRSTTDQGHRTRIVRRVQMGQRNWQYVLGLPQPLRGHVNVVHRI